MKSTTFNLHTLQRRVRPLTENWMMYLLLLLFMTGLLFGALAVKKENDTLTEFIITFYSRFLENKKTAPAVSLFLYVLFCNAAVLLTTFFLGLNAVGIPVVAIVPPLCGFCIGTAAGYLYKIYLLKGLGYCAVILFPCAIVSAAGILYSCKDSIQMSQTMLCMLANRRVQQGRGFRAYAMRYLIYVALGAFAALLNVLATHLFIGLFQF